MRTQTVDMSFQYGSGFGSDNLPDAYERLLIDAMQGDASLFARSDEIELSWRLVDPILGMRGARRSAVDLLRAGHVGAAESDMMLAREFAGRPAAQDRHRAATLLVQPDPDAVARRAAELLIDCAEESIVCAGDPGSHSAAAVRRASSTACWLIHVTATACRGR